ncbi:MAG: TIGR00341 family protein [Candidatus Pacebacteria bacterium]|nr:TIGR00341 family protein [Candidatus Paceibacterota bacterium]
MIIEHLFKVTEKEKSEAIAKLFKHSVPSKDFFLMVLLSILMATLGLLADSSAVVVGSMLIAPILYPILGLSMGVIMSDFSLVSKSFITFAKASLLGILVSAGITLLLSSQSDGYTAEILARTEPTLISLLIGATAGFAAAFAIVKNKLTDMLPGVAISVALIPPLAVVGIGLAKMDITMLFNSLLLFIVNTIGVIFTAIIVFSLMNFYGKRKEAEVILKKEEQEIEKEN